MLLRGLRSPPLASEGRVSDSTSAAVFCVATTVHLSPINNGCNACPARCRKPIQFIDLEYAMQLSYEEGQNQPMGEQRAQFFPTAFKGLWQILERSDYISSNSSCSYTIREFGSGRGLFLGEAVFADAEYGTPHEAASSRRNNSRPSRIQSASCWSRQAVGTYCSN